MIAEPMDRPYTRETHFEEVDIEKMTVDELLREQIAVKAEVGRIKADLNDEERVFRLGINYPDWRRRARRALGHRIEERRLIHVTLQEKQRALAEAKRLERAERAKASQKPPPKPSLDVAERAEAVRLRVEAAGGADALLRGVVLAFRHLAGDGDDLPTTVTPEDRLALTTAGKYLRSRYGNEVLS